jgi:hypothetical protein
MAIESANYVNQLVSSNPAGTDQRSTLANHMRLVKQVSINTFPNLNSEVSATAGSLNFCIGLTANAQGQLNGINSAIIALSANLRTQISNTSAALSTAKLNISATAISAILWGASAKYIQTATPALGANDIWFQPEQ